MRCSREKHGIIKLQLGKERYEIESDLLGKHPQIYSNFTFGLPPQWVQLLAPTPLATIIFPEELQARQRLGLTT